ncbi:hypothetical protein [Bradyrhizobium sp. CCGUVB23]|uniref:hypothetical protein n=1 Tax=Bradyrhizobium sp. CCGUVB23 TaxID=2949630 RepID=UPI003531F93F
MREMGVRGVLVYCADHRCGHWTTLSADRWPDEVRVSDIEPRFTCSACGRSGADVRPDFNWNKPVYVCDGLPLRSLCLTVGLDISRSFDSHAVQQGRTLFENLVGECQQGGRHGNAERFGGLGLRVLDWTLKF